MTQVTKSAPKRQSEKLTDAERQKLQSFIDQHASLSGAADQLKMKRHVIDSIRLRGSASPANIAILRRQLKRVA